MNYGNRMPCKDLQAPLAGKVIKSCLMETYAQTRLIIGQIFLKQMITAR
jgi:hypothetical protein